METDIRGNLFISYAALLTLTLLLAPAAFYAFAVKSYLPIAAKSWLVFFLVLAIIFSFWSLRNFVAGFLMSLFCFMVSWRLAGMYGLYLLSYGFLLVFMLYFLNFIYCVYSGNKLRGEAPILLPEWQAIFIRIYIGLNFIPHFTEKLFAGPLPHQADVNAFIQLSVPHPDFFVWMAGFCELGSAIALSLGFILRIGALCSVLYLLIAAYLGHHFNLGFIWASPGGGWEFTVMWSMFIFSYALTGSHRFSMDQCLKENPALSRGFKKLL